MEQTAVKGEGKGAERFDVARHVWPTNHHGFSQAPRAHQQANDTAMRVYAVFWQSLRARECSPTVTASLTTESIRVKGPRGQRRPRGRTRRREELRERGLGVALAGEVAAEDAEVAGEAEVVRRDVGEPRRAGVGGRRDQRTISGAVDALHVVLRRRDEADAGDDADAASERVAIARRIERVAPAPLDLPLPVLVARRRGAGAADRDGRYAGRDGVLADVAANEAGATKDDELGARRRRRLQHRRY